MNRFSLNPEATIQLPNNKNSILSRTLFISMVGVLVVLITAGLLVENITGKWLEKRFDSNLKLKIEVMQGLLIVEEGILDFDFSDEAMNKYSTTTSPEYFEIWLSNGQNFKRSISLKNSHLLREVTKVGSTNIRNILLPDGRSGRMITTTFIPVVESETYIDKDVSAARSSKIVNLYKQVDSTLTMSYGKLSRVTIALAEERETLDASIVNAGWFLFSIFLILFFTLLVVVRLSVARGLRPLDNLRKEIETIEIESDNSSISIDYSAIELDSIVEILNQLLVRIRRNIKKEQQFSSDIAHELRTPIAEIRTISDVCLIGNETSRVLKDSIKDILDVSVHMGELVERLSPVTREKTTDKICDRVSVDIIKMIEAELGVFNLVLSRKKVNYKLDIKGNRKIDIIRTDMKGILTNLISNAVFYSPSHSRVVIRWEKLNYKFKLSISNRTSTLDKEDLPFIFERLWKKDRSRADSRRFGIGLYLVKLYCLNSNYEIHTNIDANIFTITIAGDC